MWVPKLVAAPNVNRGFPTPDFDHWASKCSHNRFSRFLFRRSYEVRKIPLFEMNAKIGHTWASATEQRAYRVYDLQSTSNFQILRWTSVGSTTAFCYDLTINNWWSQPCQNRSRGLLFPFFNIEATSESISQLFRGTDSFHWLCWSYKWICDCKWQMLTLNSAQLLWVLQDVVAYGKVYVPPEGIW